MNGVLPEDQANPVNITGIFSKKIENNMKFLPTEDTIVALSSPLGSGAIALIRMSGSDALSCANKLLRKPLAATNARMAQFSEIIDTADQRVIDQVVATYFQSPASYTGDDLVEITCHCNPLIIDQILKASINAGARIAEPGEFTYRAFLNGKLDLAQAESVAEVIRARSQQSLNQSLRHLEGRLTERVEEIKKDLLGYLSLVEISLDFSEEEIELLPTAELQRRIEKTIDRITRLLTTYDYGRLLQEGIKLVIIGKPNVGKSSLLNVLAEKERAIVSDIPGTTRDYIEAAVNIGGLAVQAMDTAGIRQTSDRVEAIGVERAIEQIHGSDIVLCLFDGHQEMDGDDRTLMSVIEEHQQTAKFVLVLSKTDLGTLSSVEKSLEKTAIPLVKISARSGSGLERLAEVVKSQLISDSSLESEEVVVTSARHQRALQATRTALEDTLEAVKLGASEEILAVDLRLAMDHLGLITGETTSEDVLNHIFSSFCIGK